MGQPFIGQIIAVGFPFAPIGWLPCDGSLYPISEYDALYALLGTTYGGNGTSNFAVPDLRGRSPVNVGQGTGLSPYAQGQVGGAESVVLTASQIASHSHQFRVSANAGTTNVPGTTVVLAQNPEQTVNVYGAPPANTALAPGSIGASQLSNQPHENRQPYLAINYIICYSGIFPSRP